MKFIDKIQLKKEFRGIKPFSLVFKDGLNVIVGENGVGKTTIFKMMTDLKLAGDIFKMIFTCPKSKPQFRYLDTEKDNPRQKDFQNSGLDSFTYGVLSHFQSHGETIFPLVQATRDFKDVIVFVDEPEAGVSLSNQKKLLTAFRKTIKNGCQLIIATHSYPIIKGAQDVYSLDSRQWIKSIDYLNNVL